jgi:hypothetical protein
MMTTFFRHSGNGGVNGVNGPDGLSGTAGMKGAVRLIVGRVLLSCFSKRFSKKREKGTDGGRQLPARQTHAVVFALATPVVILILERS